MQGLTCATCSVLYMYDVCCCTILAKRMPYAGLPIIDMFLLAKFVDYNFSGKRFMLLQYLHIYSFNIGLN